MTTHAHTDLLVDGMTCASCARRVEQSLATLDGVDAHVNFATGMARVTHTGHVDAADLVARVEHAGYDARVHEPHAASHDHMHVDADPRGLRARVVVSAVLSAPIVLFMLVPGLQFEGWERAALALGTPVALWGAWPFHLVALRGARHGAATMDTLVSIGVTAAWGWSAYSVALLHHAHSYVEVAAVTTTLLLAGRVLEARARTDAGAAIRGLLELATRSVRVLDSDGVGERDVDAEQVLVGDLVVVRPGERIAVDGVVEIGSAAVDTSLVTGEPVPAAASAGSDVLGGTVALDGRLVVRATRVGRDTAVSQVARLVEEAQAGQAPIQRLADRISGVFVPIVLAIAAATLAGWLLAGADAAAAISAAIAVLIVACPCALGLATPAALLVGTGRGARLGIVIRGAEVLERAHGIDTVLLDKTGTLTTAQFELVDVVRTDPTTTADDALRTAWALEAASEHPLARGVARGARERLGDEAPLPVEAFTNHAGRGVSGTVNGQPAAVGSTSLLAELGFGTSAELEQVLAAAHAAGTTGVLVGWDGRARAALTLRDEVKAESRDAVAALHALGLRTELVTGDADAVAHRVAEQIGIAAVTASALPADKDALVAARQASGHRVAMVGDGVNDSPALTRADLGIAIGTGADVAIEASDLTLVSGSPWSIVDAIRLARATLATIRGNLFWAFAYNAAAIPLAAAGLLNPMVAGGAMAASSLFVLGNSLRLRRFRSARSS